MLSSKVLGEIALLFRTVIANGTFYFSLVGVFQCVRRQVGSRSGLVAAIRNQTLIRFFVIVDSL